MGQTEKRTTPMTAAVDIMHVLRGGYRVCQSLEEKTLHVCEYHRNRCNCRIDGVRDGGGAESLPFHLSEPNAESRGNLMGALKITPDIRRIFSYMEGNFQVAGGWYLIQQQREWLQKRLVAHLKKRDSSMSIMVAGVAGYAHFFSFLKILIDAAVEVQYPLEQLHVVVVDRCTAPLEEILSVLNLSFLSRHFYPFSHKLGDMKMRWVRTNYKFISQMREDIKKIKIETKILSLLDNVPEALYGRFDIVIEHFLTSMVEKNMEDIKKIRAFYSVCLKDGGTLLTASGFPSNAFINTFLSLHSENGFLLVEETAEKVWDPFGLSRHAIHLFLHGAENTTFYVPLENALLEFCLKGKQKK